MPNIEKYFLIKNDKHDQLKTFYKKSTAAKK
ncbi:hypothetical protein HNQ03_002857 [Chryseobacterium sp. 16F]|uniref:Uncharacterized protein n=1 Tax=Frigoriflavimonas asaccharolytica TaxID=2735899 RepID=A0A8J8K9K6_9FLAO|nr:hypothetical protein [Frigoriflavimonas asaccharolytica]